MNMELKTIFFELLDDTLMFNGLDHVEKAVKIIEMLRLTEMEMKQLKEKLYPIGLYRNVESDSGI